MYSEDLFERLKQVTFQPCELDNIKVRSYLDQVNSSYRIKPYIKQVLAQTVRIPTTQVCVHLRNMCVEYLSNPSNPRPTYVFFPKKIGSEQYFFSQVYDLFPEIVIPTNIITETKLDQSIFPDQINLLIVDDASFSGNNTIQKIDNLSFCNKKIKINYIVIIPYQLEPIDLILSKIRLPNAQIERINLINVPGYIQPPYIKLPSYELGNESNKISTCFFDHKVPNEFGSWPQIYLQGYTYNSNQQFGDLFVNSFLPTKRPILDIFALDNQEI